MPVGIQLFPFCLVRGNQHSAQIDDRDRFSVQLNRNRQIPHSFRAFPAEGASAQRNRTASSLVLQAGGELGQLVAPADLAVVKLLVLSELEIPAFGEPFIHDLHGHGHAAQLFHHQYQFRKNHGNPLVLQICLKI
ncbi:hypothetical protein SDC9_206047 [bioreactor metagenome]|uniref:Uncharacterized protein n=1 Tax=bioreactor metagenome TaxID=1076179 RepID=A0A645JFG7_9ZZZZ